MSLSVCSPLHVLLSIDSAFKFQGSVYSVYIDFLYACQVRKNELFHYLKRLSWKKGYHGNFYEDRKIVILQYRVYKVLL